MPTSVIIALIPAYNPSDMLINYVHDVLHHFTHVVVVNDGSQSECQLIFDTLRGIDGVHVVSHALNCGKGAALKTGMNYITCEWPDITGLVTIDADGQHLTEDVVKVATLLAERPNSLIIGGRQFEGEVPLRSRIGNWLTRILFRAMTGIKLHDTQSGLRGIPMMLVKKLLRIRSNGYEFELDMLLVAQRLQFPIVETTIQTVYLDKNTSSHFSPIFDSIKIYFVLFRFTIIAVLSALIDYAIFMAIYFLLVPKVFLCLMVGRLISMIFNYINVRRFAFHSEQPHSRTFPKYFILAVISFTLAYILIRGLMNSFGLDVVIAKIISELVLFIVNFLVQRDFIFRKKSN